MIENFNGQHTNSSGFDPHSDDVKLAWLLATFSHTDTVSEYNSYHNSLAYKEPEKLLRDIEWLKGYPTRRIRLCLKFWASAMPNYIYKHHEEQIQECLLTDGLNAQESFYHQLNNRDEKSAIERYFASLENKIHYPLDFSAKLKKYYKLITGEWESAMHSQLIASTHINALYEARQSQEASGQERPCVFRPYSKAEILRADIINLHDRAHKTPEDDYKAVCYELGYRLLFDPLAKIYIDPETEKAQFHSERVRLSDHQVKRLRNFAKTEEGKRILAAGKNSLLYYVCEEGWSYYTSETPLDLEENPRPYPSMRNLVASLEKVWRTHPLTDARHAALCLLAMTPEDKSIEERVDIVFGDHSVSTLKKVDALLDLNNWNTGRFFLTNEMNAYLGNRSSQEVTTLYSWAILMKQTRPYALRVLEDCPEAVLIDSHLHYKRWQGSKNPRYIFEGFSDYLDRHSSVDENFFRTHEKEIKGIRYGDRPITDREQFISNLPGMINDAIRINEGEWTQKFKDGIQAILAPEKIRKRSSDFELKVK